MAANGFVYFIQNASLHITHRTHQHLPSLLAPSFCYCNFQFISSPSKDAVLDMWHKLVLALVGENFSFMQDIVRPLENGLCLFFFFFP